MITRLRIENLGVFALAEAEFAPGLNVITGETGAGKTVLLEGLRLVGGARPDARLIGPRAEEAYVEAAFEAERVPRALAELAAEGEELVLARRLRRFGPARALCSGRSCSAAQLAEAAAELFSLTGQHAARRLVSPSWQLELLDRAAGLEGGREELAGLWGELRRARGELDRLRSGLLDREARLARLREEVERFDALAPGDEEEAELEAEQARLAHAEELAARAAELYQGLYGAEGSVGERLGGLRSAAEQGAEHDPELGRVSSAMLEAEELVRDAAERVRSLLDRYEADPGRLAEVEERLAAIGELRRRFHGLEVAQIRERVERSRAELERLADADAALEEAEEAARRAEEAYERKAREAAKKRRSAARPLARSVEEQLADLALPEARLRVELAEAEAGPLGRDRVEIALQANPGLPPAPLGRGASGGELARLNLALLLATSSGAGAYVFDEIDAGIGGRTAHAVAEKLARLAQRAQVIVITHLAQIAVRAERHFVVEKRSSGESTETTLRRLESEQERQAEIARLIGADERAGERAAELVRAGSSA